MSVVTRGDREISIRFDTFPARARQKLDDRIRALTATLQERVQAATPFRTGLLRSEITPRVFDDSPTRIAGYVSVYAGDRAKEYPKAATLEYGTNKPRRIADHGGIFRRLGRGQRRIESRLTKSVHIEAFRYLRGPLEEMRPEIEAALDETMTEAAAEGDA